MACDISPVTKFFTPTQFETSKFSTPNCGKSRQNTVFCSKQYNCGGFFYIWWNCLHLRHKYEVDGKQDKSRSTLYATITHISPPSPVLLGARVSVFGWPVVPKHNEALFWVSFGHVCAVFSSRELRARDGREDTHCARIAGEISSKIAPGYSALRCRSSWDSVSRSYWKMTDLGRTTCKFGHLREWVRAVEWVHEWYSEWVSEKLFPLV